ncbi:MAG: TonB-dependent receptor [Pseudomonadota bacterium]
MLHKPHGICGSAALFCVLTAPAFTAVAQDSDEQIDAIETEQLVIIGSQIELAGPAPGGQVADGGRAGMLGNLPYRDLPFSGSAYTEAFAQDLQADGVGDVLLSDPSVRVQKGFGNFQDVYQIRGFPVFSDDLTFNGLYGVVPRQFVAAPLVERVEVLRGVNTFVNGAAPGSSGVGGSVNLVPKRAPDERIRQFTLGYETAGTLFGAADFGQRFGTDGEWGLRTNAVVRGGDTAVEDSERDLSALSFGVDYDGDQLRFTADIGYQDNSIDRPRPQVTPTGAAPTPPDGDTNYAQDFTFSNEEQLFFTTRGEYRFTDNVVGWAALGIRDGKEENDLANPNADENGNLQALRFVNVREDDISSQDIGLRAEFDTGGVGHTLVANVSATRFQFDNAFAFSDFSRFSGGTLENPVQVAPPATTAFVGGDLNNPLTTEDARTSSVAISDTLSFMDDSVLLTLGARSQTIEQKTFNATTGAQEGDIDSDAVTPALGIVYKPNARWALFANAAEALQRGAVAPATSGGNPVTNAGEILDPLVSEQIELGAKYGDERFGFGVSLFSISQRSAIVVNDTFTDAGEQVNEGIEITMHGEPTAGLRLLGGVTLLSATLDQTQGGINQGQDAVGVPETMANFGVVYDVASVSGLTVDGRVIHTGSQYLDAANTLSADSWTRLDLGLKYQTRLGGRPATLRARVENVTDEAYWASVGGFPGANYLVQGEPRSISVSLTSDF